MVRPCCPQGVCPSTGRVAVAAICAHRVLALPLVTGRDGQQVVVGTAGMAPVDLNVASVGQLEALPGVGLVLAQRIVDFRTAHGAFGTVDDLEQVGRIGPGTMDDFRPLVTV